MRTPGGLIAARLPLLALVLVNAAAQVAYFFVARHDLFGAASAAEGHGVLVTSWVAALALGLGLGLFALGLAEARLTGGRRRTVDVITVLVQAVVWLLAVADVKAYRTTGVHLYSPVVLATLDNDGAGRELALGRGTTLSLASFAACALLVEGLALAGLRRWLLPERHARAGRTATVAAAVCLATAFATAIPLRARALDRDAVALDALPLHEVLLGDVTWTPQWGEPTYLTVGRSPPRVGKRTSVLFILVESLRSDALTETLAPHLTALRGRCLTSARHFSGGHTTELGVFTSLYGVTSHYFAPFARARQLSWPLGVLRGSGYQLAGASASALRHWNGAGFMLDAFDRFDEHLDELDGKGDREVADAALRFRVERDPARPFFLFLFFNATHHNYRYPKAYERFTPVMDEDYDHFLSDDRLAPYREQIQNRYRNAVGYVDALIAEVLAAYSSEIDRGELAVIVTGDHGEEFWDHGLLGHGSTRFENARIQVPLIACVPGAGAREVARSSHVDLMPTLMDALGVDVPAASWSEGTSLLRAPPPRRTLVVGGTTFPLNNRRVCLIDESTKTWLELCPGDAWCLRPTKVTDLDDRPLDVPADEDAIGRFTREFERFAPLTNK